MKYASIVQFRNVAGKTKVLINIAVTLVAGAVALK